MVIVPFIAIVFMYICILFFVKKKKIESKKLLIMSAAICATGLLSCTPNILLIAFKVCFKVAVLFDFSTVVECSGSKMHVGA